MNVDKMRRYNRLHREVVRVQWGEPAMVTQDLQPYIDMMQRFARELAAAVDLPRWRQ